MNAVDADTIPRVLDPGVLEALGEQVVSAASLLETAMVTAHDRWRHLREVFVATGAEGAYAMLDPALGASHEYIDAMIQARVVLTDAASGVLPALQKRRDELVARVGEVNLQHAEATDTVPQAESTYWSEYGRDPDSDATAIARSERIDALRARDNAVAAVSTLKNDIETFRKDVDRDEEFIARQLGWIIGGETVYGAWGDKVYISQTYWGESVSTYPGGPTTSYGLSDYLINALSKETVKRIDWLATASDDDVAAWLADHPDFASTVGFVEPAAAAALWARLSGNSGRDGDGSWATGPLAQLFALAPFALGNLNGLKATDRDEFNRETLRQTMDDVAAVDLEVERLLWIESGNSPFPYSEETMSQRRAELRDELLTDAQKAAIQTQKALDSAQSQSPLETIQLIAFEIPANGGERDMRAAISVGNLDTAEAVGVMIPGMNSSVSGSMGGLVNNAIFMQEESRRFNASTTATVVWMGYESPTENPLSGRDYVGEETRAQEGAAGFTRFMNGVDTSNAGAQTTVFAHSYGTRVATYALTDGPYGGARVDHLVMYGSPGIAEGVASVDDLVGVPPGEVYSTKSWGDQYSTGTTLGNLYFVLKTEEYGGIGVAGMGAFESNLRGDENADPNDDAFWGNHDKNVFESTGVNGHSIDTTSDDDGNRYAGYWTQGSDPLQDGALIMAGRGREVE